MLGYIISDKQKINVEEHEIHDYLVSDFLYDYEYITCEDIENNKIQNFDILNKTNLNIFVVEHNMIMYKNDIINNACRYGHIQVLEWFKNSGYEFKYDAWAISLASMYGHIEVLEWFKNSSYEFKYNEWAIISASENGHIQVLEWFKNSGYEFKYNAWAIDDASDNGHIQVLEWFKNSDYEFKYNKKVFRTTSIKILKFSSNHFNIKKLIKWSKKIFFIKTIKFKTNNKYLKGYQKN